MFQELDIKSCLVTIFEDEWWNFHFDWSNTEISKKVRLKTTRCESRHEIGHGSLWGRFKVLISKWGLSILIVKWNSNLDIKVFVKFESYCFFSLNFKKSSNITNVCNMYMIHRLFSLTDGVIHRFCSNFLHLTLDQNTAVFDFTWNWNDSSSKIGFHHEYASIVFILTFDENTAVFDFT